MSDVEVSSEATLEERAYILLASAFSKSGKVPKGMPNLQIQDGRLSEQLKLDPFYKGFADGFKKGPGTAFMNF